MNLLEGIAREVERVVVIREHARELGRPGVFLVAMIDLALAEARGALDSGDVVRMIASYKSLREFEE